jgi:hypothetical protein
MHSLNDQIAVAADNLRAAGQDDRADAILDAGAYLSEVIHSPLPDLEENLTLLRDNADTILRITAEAPTPAAKTLRSEAARRDQHSRRNT